jgi:two-component system, response regulator PdtaR
MCPDTQDEPIFSKDGHLPFAILVVEDEVLVRLDVAEALRVMDYTVLEAASADEARTVFGGIDAIDLVFSDINMPGSQNGAELAQWIAANHPQTPIILTSGIRPALEAAAAGCAGIVAIIDKPYDNDAVEKEIRAVLARRAAK